MYIKSKLVSIALYIKGNENKLPYLMQRLSAFTEKKNAFSDRTSLGTQTTLKYKSLVSRWPAQNELYDIFTDCFGPHIDLFGYFLVRLVLLDTLCFLVLYVYVLMCVGGAGVLVSHTFFF